VRSSQSFSDRDRVLDIPKLHQRVAKLRHRIRKVSTTYLGCLLTERRSPARARVFRHFNGLAFCVRITQKISHTINAHHPPEDNDRTLLPLNTRWFRDRSIPSSGRLPFSGDQTGYQISRTPLSGTKSSLKTSIIPFSHLTRQCFAPLVK
jgi:hypothetical protein